MNLIRTTRFTPYRKSMGPSFTLTMWDTGYRDNRGQTTIGYRLRAIENGKRRDLFNGSDFNGSPLHADDADECVRSLMGFLTLRPGDTDSDYFKNYTPEQVEYCEQHAEALGCEVMSRFPEE